MVGSTLGKLSSEAIPGPPCCRGGHEEDALPKEVILQPLPRFSATMNDMKAAALTSV
jgi:hypothetical protein